MYYSRLNTRETFMLLKFLFFPKVCVCVFVCERERQRQRKNTSKRGFCVLLKSQTQLSNYTTRYHILGMNAKMINIPYKLYF